MGAENDEEFETGKSGMSQQENENEEKRNGYVSYAMTTYASPRLVWTN